MFGSVLHLPFLAVSAAPDATCSVLEKLDGVQCYGLEKDDMPDAEACMEACCRDTSCEVWQFNPMFACYRGKSSVCMRSGDSFASGSVGERLRGSAFAGNGIHWFGRQQNYAELVDLDPEAFGPRELVIQGLDGESYRLWRNGARLEVDISCWSNSRHPQGCCDWPRTPTPPRPCWGDAGMAEHCCKDGVSADRKFLYNVYTRTTPFLSHAELAYFERLLPEEKINEANFNASRTRWASGWHPPDLLCPSASMAIDGQRATVDASTVLWPLAVLLAAHMQITGTFVNIGAGTCLPPDPLYQLLASPEGYGFLGLAVEGDATRLKRCEVEMASTFATVVPVHLTLNPIDAVHQLLPFLGAMFPEALPPWPLDFLVVDIDGVDCLVVEELMQLVRPKVMQLEIAFHFPPPFRFSMHWDSEKSPRWNDEYDIDRLNPVSGCSLSYALHKFKPFGYHLLRLTPADAIFVHESVAPIMESGLGTKLPQDEFLCYRSSTLYAQMPGNYVREWFYAPHPATAFSRIWSNISSLNKEIGREDVPFTLDF
ncbi:unnamed protein product [Durusdinium trenchii]|uniref:Apple domain-containing protein n=2 Tax=Durusdinium trenchii TaxID=1381693 RepID=A0ABP0S0J1_9DINO